MKKVLIQFISAQPMPNYIAIKHYQPDVVISLVSDMFKKVNQKFDVIFDHIEFKKKSYESFNMVGNLKTLNQLINEYHDCELIINFTGGTKLMTAPAFLVDKHSNALYTYVDSQNLQINEIRLDADNKLSDATISMDKFEVPYQDFFTMKNEDISGTEITEVSPEMTDNKPLAKAVAEGDESVYSCTNPKERGQLFEEYVFTRLKQHAKPKKKFDEVVGNVVLPLGKGAKLNKQIGQTDKSELDLFITKGLYACVIECKSGKFTQDHVMKVRGITERVLGPYAKSIIISKDAPRDPGLIEKAADNKVILLNIKEHGNRLPAYVEAVMLSKNISTVTNK